MSADKSAQDSSRKFMVEIMNGPEDGRVLSCKDLPISIGRAGDNIVHLPYDHLISRHHAKIIQTGDDLLLCDLGSRNGTFIRNERVRKEAVLEPKKLFRIGATLLVLGVRSAKS